MRLATYSSDDHRPRVGAISDDGSEIIEILPSDDADTGFDMVRLLGDLALGRTQLSELQRLTSEAPPAWCTPLSAVRLHAPVPSPNSIRDCMVFERHVTQCMQRVVRRAFPPIYWLDACGRRLGCPLLRVPRVWRERPIYYKGNRRSVIGSGDTVRWPKYATQLDFELEVGVFVGREGKNLSVQEAEKYIAGYALFNDFSARQTQFAEMRGHLGPTKGKDFDTGNAIGPWLTTPDEVELSTLECSVRVNGELLTTSGTNEMYFSFAEIIAYVSQDETLYPGDFIAAGTLPSGCGLELDRWLQRGDVIELDGGPLGVLRNEIL